jgi:hypothetical protein
MLDTVPSYTERVEISKHLTGFMQDAHGKYGLARITVPVLPDVSRFESSDEREQNSYRAFDKVHASLKGHAVMDQPVVSMLTYLLENNAAEWTEQENSASHRKAGASLRDAYITSLLRDVLPIVRTDAALKGALEAGIMVFGAPKPKMTIAEKLAARLARPAGSADPAARPREDPVERVQAALAIAREKAFVALKVECVVAIETLVCILAGADKREVRRVLLDAAERTNDSTRDVARKANAEARRLHSVLTTGFGVPSSKKNAVLPASFSVDDTAYFDKRVSLDQAYYWFDKPASYGYAQLLQDHLRNLMTDDARTALNHISPTPGESLAAPASLNDVQRAFAMSVVFYIDAGSTLRVASPKVTGAYYTVGKIRAMGSSVFLDLGYPALALETDTRIDDSAYAFIKKLCKHASVDIDSVFVEGEDAQDGERTLTTKGLGALHTRLATGASLELALRAVAQVLFMKINPNGTLVLSSARPCDLFSIVDGDLVRVHDVHDVHDDAKCAPRASTGSFGAHV